MIVLPIVGRELRMAARRRRIYYQRFMAAFVTVATGASMISFGPVVPGGGAAIFTMLTICIAILAVISGSASYDSISGEKREGTIGFLFLTDLKGRDIVLGKLAASAVPSIYAAMGVLPVLAIGLEMGGVSAQQFCEASLALLNLFFLCHAVAMLGSAWFRDHRNAAGFPMLVIAAYVIESGVSLILDAIHRHTASAVLQVINPGFTLAIALGLRGRSNWADFGISLAAVHLTAWLAVALASWVLPYRWQDKPKQPNRMRAWWNRWRFGTVEKQTALRRQLLGINPFFWLSSRRQFSPASLWLAFGIVCVCLASIGEWDVKRNDDPWSEVYPGLLLFGIVIFHWTLKLLVASVATQSLQTQRNDGLLEAALCCTPMSKQDILSGQWLALWRLVLRPTIAVVFFSIISATLMKFQLRRNADANSASLFLFATTLLLVPDMISLGWTAMWMTMAQPKERNIALKAVISVCLTPWIGVGVIYAVAYVKSSATIMPPWIPLIFSTLVIDIGLSILSRNRLRKNFRAWAVPSAAPPLSLWGYLGRFLGQTTRLVRSNKFVD